MSGMLRTFVAVESPPALRSALQEVQSDLRRLGVRVRWVRPENIHLTLKFLGGRAMRPFPLTWSGWGCSPDSGDRG